MGPVHHASFSLKVEGNAWAAVIGTDTVGHPDDKHA